jgi:dUTP pyrophosphatase
MISGIIKFAKVKEDAIIPTKRDEDAGYDLYANFESPQMIIEPFTSRLIPLGIASAFSKDYVALLCERGSTGVRNMKKNAGVIDSGFRSEWQFCLYNANSKPLIITKETDKNVLEILEEDYIVYSYSKALGQMLLLPLAQVKQFEITYEELLKINSERNLGMLGSSGK